MNDMAAFGRGYYARSVKKNMEVFPYSQGPTPKVVSVSKPVDVVEDKEEPTEEE